MRESRMTRNGHVRFGERSRETRSSRGEKVRSAPTLFSPMLSNIYLNKLDTFVETELLPTYTRRTRRRVNAPYGYLQGRASRLRKLGHGEEVQHLRRQMQQLPSLDPADPDYRRIHYLRYADDWLVGC